ncbi:MAG: hypothetical protein R3Y19_04875 [Rikenellaceae bacterium]
MENSTIITLLAALVAVALMVLGLGITVLRTGKPLQSDIGDNDAMHDRGIECAAAQMRREEAEYMGRSVESGLGCGKGDCISCAVEDQCTE